MQEDVRDFEKEKAMVAAKRREQSDAVMSQMVSLRQSGCVVTATRTPHPRVAWLTARLSTVHSTALQLKQRDQHLAHKRRVRERRLKEERE